MLREEIKSDRTPMEEDNTHVNTKWHTQKFGLQCGRCSFD